MSSPSSWRDLLRNLISNPDECKRLATEIGVRPLTLSRLLPEAGCQNIGQRAHVIDFSAGTPAYETMYQNCMVAFKLVQPFLIKMGVVTPEEADQRYEQMLLEMMSEDFTARWDYITVWGQTPL